MNSLRSKPALAASVVLLLAFYATTRLAIHLHPSGSVLQPVWKNDPLQWLAIESAIVLAGAAAVALFGLALGKGPLTTRLGKLRAASRTISWPVVLWALLLGNFATSPISIVASFGNLGPEPLAPPSLPQVIAWLNFITPLTTLYCSARLLFGTVPWRADKWLGYIGAAATLFGLSWRLIALTGLADVLPLSFRGFAPLSTILWITIAVAATWTDLALARRGERLMLGRRDYAQVGYVAIGGFVLSALLLKLTSVGFWFSSRPIQLSIPYDAMLVLTTAVVLLCILDGGSLLTGNAEQRNAAPTVTSYERLGLARWLRTTLYTARFRADFGYSLFITIAFFGFALATVAQIPIIVTPFVLPLIVSGLLIGPIVVFILGILGNRPGYAAAPAIVVLVIVGLRYAIV